MKLNPIKLIGTQEFTKLDLILEKKTRFQTIRLYNTRNKKLVMTLDTFVQFVEGEDEKIYHENLTKHAFNLNKKANRFLVLGGGDGLVARNIFYLNSFADITLVDIDVELVKMFMFEKRLYKLNEMSLYHCRKFFDDAQNWVNNQEKKFDIIICDFPDPNTDNLNLLYEKDFLSKTTSLLENGGIISIQVNKLISNSVKNIIKELLGNSKEIEYEMPFLGEGNIIIGKCQF